jgi:hypothetical protein
MRIACVTRRLLALSLLYSEFLPARKYGAVPFARGWVQISDRIRMGKPGSTSVYLQGDMDDVFRLALQGIRERPEKTADRDVQMWRFGTTAYALVRNSVAGHSIQMPFSNSDIVIWSCRCS